MTDVTVLLATMNAYIPSTHFSACRTGRIMTKYLLGIRLLTPFLLGYIKVINGSPACQVITPRFNVVLPCIKRAQLIVENYLATIVEIEENPELTEDIAALGYSSHLKWDSELKKSRSYAVGQSISYNRGYESTPMHRI